ncbi:hypothetical protein NP233_g4142 [Leucocoprinus birnbaumii]|uniref:Replication protein A OB domain-containing protein n=1 Tax=Leucocoprinus birnbaumii TaxID=56174 RepID=A0AAD5YT46_9AGAR|nr:hypothetical protein NP233_g4142 [Leucocoprinus birnbaumii]
MLHFTRCTLIDECTARNIPHLKFDEFVPLSQLYEIEEGTICDIIAIVVHVSELDVQTRWYDDVRPCKISKRSLSLLDQSGYWVQATIWDPGASEFSTKPGSIVASRHVKISGFRGRSMSISSASTMYAEPMQYVPETCDALRQWHDEMGSNSKKDLSEFIGQTRFVDKEPVERMPVPLCRD